MEPGTCISINDNCTCQISGEIIGAGRYGRVFPALWLEQKVPVAVKIMHPETAQVENFDPLTGRMLDNGIIKNIHERRRAFSLESQFLQDLKDVPWVVEYLANGVSYGQLPANYSGLPIIVERKVNINFGLDMLREKKLAPDVAYSLCAQFFAMIGYAHERDIVYRDLKKEHMIWENGHLTVIDWNVSRRRGDDGANPAEDFKVFFFEIKSLLPDQIRRILDPSSRSNLYAWHILWDLNNLAKKENWSIPPYVPDQPSLAKKIGKYALLRKKYEEAWDWFDRADPRDFEVQLLSAEAQQGFTKSKRDGL